MVHNCIFLFDSLDMTFDSVLDICLHLLNMKNCREFPHGERNLQFQTHLAVYLFNIYLIIKLF